MTMDHDRIEREQIVDLYLMGKLDPEMTDRFEAHYLHCQDCLNQLELAEKLQRGLRRATAREASEQVASRQLAVFAWIARLSRSGQVGIVMTALVAVSLPAGLVLRQAGRHEVEISEVRSTLEQAHMELVDTRQEQQASREAQDAKVQAAEGEQAAEWQRLEQEIEREREFRKAAEASLARARAPRKNLPIFNLSVERGAGFEAEPSLRLHVTPAAERIVLQLELGRPAYASYRATLLRQGRGQVWRGDGLVPNYIDNLVLDLPATMLEAGDYRLNIEGLSITGEAVAVAYFTFRAVSKP